MKRGDIWTIASGPGYTGKPRPAVIVQGQAFDLIESVIVCPFTTDLEDLHFFRLEISPSEETGLRAPSRVMIDKVTAVPRVKFGNRIGRLNNEDLSLVSRALIVFLDLAP